MRFSGLAGLAAALLVLATPAAAATTYTGDRIDGIAVIERLDVSDLPAGTLSRFWFRVTGQAVGQAWYVPVIVAKGSAPGPRLLLTAAIHGDELNGVAVVQDLLPGLDLRTLKGVVVGIPGLNVPGLMAGQREFEPSFAADAVNLNRLMPGKLDGGDVGEVYAGRLWNQLFMGNADLVVDLHTQSRGTLYPMYAFAETPAAREMALALHPDVIKMDPGIRGTVENEMNAAGLTAVTLELGGPDRFDPVMIERAKAGILNLMALHGMIPARPAIRGPAPYIGTISVDVDAPASGFARLQVGVGDAVHKGQQLATVSDAFGRVLAIVTAPMDGQVLSIGTAAIRERGSLLVRIIGQSDDAVCREKGC